MKSLVVVALLAGTAWAGDTVVFSKAVTRAALDPDLDQVWFTADDKLQVLDLREARPKPQVIATGSSGEVANARWHYIGWLRR